MISRLDFMDAMLEIGSTPEAALWIAGRAQSVTIEAGAALIEYPLLPFRWRGVLERDPDRRERKGVIRLAAEGPAVLRCATRFDARFPFADSPMLVSPAGGKGSSRQELHLEENPEEWRILDSAGRLRCRIGRTSAPARKWIEDPREYNDHLNLELYPDGEARVELLESDRFFYGKFDSLPLAFLESGDGTVAFCSFACGPDEHFAGTGERFARLDLAGKTIDLVNTDGLGVNSRKCYKNVPFFLSSAGYGLFFHTSAHMRLSFADISGRAVQARVEEDALDLFVVGGKSVAERIAAYQELTGVPPALPRWSYGVWMSRMSYFNAAEVEEVGDRLREEEYPCDVLHIDTGWFEKDWVCDWRFCEERFTEPEKFLARMRDKGFKITLWQTPNIGRDNPRYAEATEKGYLAPIEESGGEQFLSDFSGQDFGGQIDFTNPEAVSWYKGMLREVLEKGAAAIKTDFGERVLKNARYAGMPASLLHNLYGLLYQRAAWEATEEVAGEETIIWARAAWAGNQRYPVHWGGDAASSWDGLAASLRGGLQLGLSGFTYWSHDIPGFHGVPRFMHSKPEAVLYLRWTQFGVFSSHMRYHGCFPREPWEYPEIADSIRAWWRLRYALIPYIEAEAEFGRHNGRALISPIVIDSPTSEAAWHIDDEYLFGRSFLVAPVMNDAGRRSVYLPAGEWIDFWTGEHVSGDRRTAEREWPLHEMPLFVRAGARIPVYPLPVASTDEMRDDAVVPITFDGSFGGIYNHSLNGLLQLGAE